MKKLILFSVVLLGLTFTFCGGKDMDGTPDGSDEGPTYLNEFEDPKKLEADADSTSTK